MSENILFKQIEIERREQKPRKNGLTMMIDWGLGPFFSRGFLLQYSYK